MSLVKDKIELGVIEAELETQKALNRLPPLLKWLVIAVIVGSVPLYFATKSISKNIWLKKYQADLLTAKPSFTDPKAPDIGKISLTTLGANTYAAVVKITNPNLDLAADQVLYHFDFYNAQKQLLYSSPPDKLFLLPNQSKYLSLPRFSASERVTTGELVLPNSLPWQKRLTIPKVELLTSAPNVYHQFAPEAFVVEGDFTNKSPYTLKQVRLTFVLFGNNNEIIGTSQRDEFTVNPFERRNYKQLWPNVNASNLVSVKVFADTDTLDKNNLGTTALPSGPAGDLSRPAENN